MDLSSSFCQRLTGSGGYPVRVKLYMWKTWPMGIPSDPGDVFHVDVND